MKLLHRFGYYLGGFSMGLVVLAFFLNGKKVSCDYGPEARVLKNINSKILKSTTEVSEELLINGIDSLTLRNILKSGDISFSKSETRKEPCGIYYIESRTSDSKNIDLRVENCDSIVTIKEIIWK